MDKPNNYSEEQIQVLEGLEPVRKRPGMYIGSTDEKGLHHLAVEIVDNSIDEALAGYCTEIDVTVNADGTLTVADNGRGIPTGIIKKEGLSAVEVVLTKLHAGGKFGGGGYTVSGGLHGVGISVVNALSTDLIVEVFQNGNHYKQVYHRGKPEERLKIVGAADRTGTTITFRPDPEIFETVEFQYDRLKNRLREVAYLNKGIVINLKDERPGQERKETFCYEGGLAEFVVNLNKNKDVLFSQPVYIDKSVKEGEVEIALQYNDGYSELIYTYANNINTEEGGSHLDGFKNALTKVINDYGKKLGVLKEDDKLSGEDVREGITAVISVKLTEPQFEGQTKTKLGNSEMRTAVARVVTEELGAYLEENPKEAKGKGSRAQRQGTYPPQKRAGKHHAAGQTCRLHREKRRPLRDLSGRGRLGRRHGEAGARQTLPGYSAAQGQNPQRGKSPSAPHTRKRGNKVHDNGFRLRHTRRFRRKQTALQQNHLHDRCRRGRQPHQDFAVDFLLPLYAAAD